MAVEIRDFTLDPHIAGDLIGVDQLAQVGCQFCNR
jgi:hypothetical protein